MASNFLTVKVHPVVCMTIVDAFERRINRQNDRALGTLLGFYEKNAVQITNCYSIPFRETNETQDIDDLFNKQMWNYYRKATPSEQQIVGWFITTRDLSEGCQLYHNYYTALVSEFSTKKELPPIVLLTMDVNFDSTSEGRLPIRAYTQVDAGVPAAGKTAQASIFHPLEVKLECFPGEEVALNSIEGELATDKRDVLMTNSLEQLEVTSGEMVQWLERVLNYVEGVLAKQEPSAEDSAFGRKLMNIVTTAATQIQPDKLDNLVKSSVRDFMMISYLSTLTKTQLSATQVATLNERP